MTEPLAVPILEAARLGGVGRSTIYSEISKGNLRILKIGRRTVITLDDLRSLARIQSTEGRLELTDKKKPGAMVRHRRPGIAFNPFQGISACPR